MNQQKIGLFLKQLRKDKGLTQEQLAEQFYVSARTVSRWETGSNIPDIGTLIDIADFYKVDIREIIDGERKSEKMNNETKTTLTQVAEYATYKKIIQTKNCIIAAVASGCIMGISVLLFGKKSQGLLYGIVPENICDIITWSTTIIAYIAVFVLGLYAYGVVDKIKKWKQKRNS